LKKYFLILILFISFLPWVVNKTGEAKSWEDDVMSSMTIEEKIGQLFMVAAYSNKGDAHVKSIEDLIAKYHIGGLIFFQGTPSKQLELTNYYQSMSKTPLFIGIDGEWGLNMRLKNTRKYPYSMTLGSLPDDSLIYKMGASVAKECKALGIHINFAPVADVNSNPNNPIINFRSFGENKELVARYALAYAKGMQDEGVIACAKHFPGHGDTDKDSHKDLPKLNHSKTRLDTLELYPFKYLFDNGVMSTMVAHINIPAIDSRKNRAASISDKVVNGILRDELEFEGLSFTDALNMKGVSSYFDAGDLELQAYEAGNDILLFPENIPSAVKKIKAALESGRLSMTELDKRVRKILIYKKWSGLDKYEAPLRADMDAALFSKEGDAVIQEIANNSICLVSNKDNMIPMRPLSGKTAFVCIGDDSKSAFLDNLSKQHKSTRFFLNRNTSAYKANTLKEKLKYYKRVVFSFEDTKIWSVKSFGYNYEVYKLVNSISASKDALVVAFTNAYILKRLTKSDNTIIAYQDDPAFHAAAADIVNGDLKAKGKLPVRAGKYSAGHGIIQAEELGEHMTYSDLASEGFKTNMDSRIQLILGNVMSTHAAPGGQVLVARNGKIVYENAFGYHTYENKTPVTLDDIYDIASITKVAATTLSVMRLHEEGKIALTDAISKHLPMLEGTNKEHVTIRDAMLHQARLEPWIPFFLGTLDKRDRLYDSLDNLDHNVNVANCMFIDSTYEDSMLQQIIETPLLPRKKYKYSDLGFILLKYMIENITQEPFDEYVQNNFYIPLGLDNTGYRPLRKFCKVNIVPTENDTLFRKQLLDGYVHDPACAMMGGVAGHAGVFSNVSDLAILFQMLLNGGTYNGKRYFKASTVDLFTSYKGYNSRRAIGFDKPEYDSRRISPASKLASSKTFGHTGFTGTCVWADPKYDLIYIFLSNRIHPDQENKTLIRKNFRTDIQGVIYQSIQR
jgi:beta-N-acetylhexosaminidase